MDKRRIFIACSTEYIYLAENLQEALAKKHFPEIWNQGFFELNKTTIESLEKKLPDFDIAIFLLSPDDTVASRGKSKKAPRDNIVFELGLSHGIIGRENTFLIAPRNCTLKLPTDILGVTYCEYDMNVPNMLSEMSIVSSKICRAIEESVKKK